MKRRRKLSKAKQMTRYRNRNNSNNDSGDHDDVPKKPDSTKVDQDDTGGSECASGTSKNQDDTLKQVNLARSSNVPNIDLTREEGEERVQIVKKNSEKEMN